MDMFFFGGGAIILSTTQCKENSSALWASLGTPFPMGFPRARKQQVHYLGVN